MKLQIIKFNEPDSDGDIFTKNSIIINDRPIRVTKDFDTSKVIGLCELSIDETSVYGEIKFAKTVLGQKVEKLVPNKLYPTIGFSRVGDKIKIYEIGICDKEMITSLRKFEFQRPK